MGMLCASCCFPDPRRQHPRTTRQVGDREATTTASRHGTQREGGSKRQPIRSDVLRYYNQGGLFSLPRDRDRDRPVCHPGERLDGMVYMGCVYYQRLRHMVQDKYHARALGPARAAVPWDRGPRHGFRQSTRKATHGGKGPTGRSAHRRDGARLSRSGPCRNMRPVPSPTVPRP